MKSIMTYHNKSGAPLIRSIIPRIISRVPSGATLHSLSKFSDVPIGFALLQFEAVYCFICSRRRVVVARYRMIRLVLIMKCSYFLTGLMEQILGVEE